MKRRAKLARVAALLLAAGWLAALACAWCSAWSWYGELAASARPWLELCAVFPVTACALAGWRFRACVLAGTAAVSAAPLARVWLPATDEARGREQLVVVTANVLAGNATSRGAFARLREQAADVLALQELTPAVLPELDALADLYPHVLLVPAERERWRAGT